MFHHFCNENHPQGQGALSGQQFSAMIDWLSERCNLLSADEYLYKFKHALLKNEDICFTFDDALLCQAEIAAPILKERNIQAFFFIYSSPFSGTPDFLEVFRYFRTTQFNTVDLFYESFFEQAQLWNAGVYATAQQQYDSSTYLKNYPFYTADDKWFRFLRDEVLGKEKYEEIMFFMMKNMGFDSVGVLKKLWMNETHVRALQSAGHQIGLHSYTHPTTMHLLDRQAQTGEYEKNYRHLSELLNTAPISMSHPCGRYNADTLEILHGQGIQIGFGSNKGAPGRQSSLEIPREDHANIWAEMQK